MSGAKRPRRIGTEEHFAIPEQLDAWRHGEERLGLAGP